jgi:ribosomal-protein-alanine N-acetyltransferase
MIDFPAITLETKHLRLVSCTPVILRAALVGNTTLASALGVSVPDNWTEFGTGALQYALDRLLEDPKALNWFGYFPIHKADRSLIGSGGYKGPPSTEGSVELGYEIVPEYRNRGLATEMTQALLENAFIDPRVAVVIAHTLAHENASTRVLNKCGFKKIADLHDPDDGAIWEWALEKDRSTRSMRE